MRSSASGADPVLVVVESATIANVSSRPSASTAIPAIALTPVSEPVFARTIPAAAAPALAEIGRAHV